MPDLPSLLKESPSQTAGPYVHIGCTPNFTGIDSLGADFGRNMKSGQVLGEEISISGVIFDGAGEVVRDALVEIWQSNSEGLFASGNDDRGQADPNFIGWGRSPCDPESGEFNFETVKPGAVPWSNGELQAPHITVWIVARGINIGLQTRLYFDDEPEANAKDPILGQLHDIDRAATLIATKTKDQAYRFDIVLQGPNETVFFDI